MSGYFFEWHVCSYHSFVPCSRVALCKASVELGRRADAAAHSCVHGERLGYCVLSCRLILILATSTILVVIDDLHNFLVQVVGLCLCIAALLLEVGRTVTCTASIISVSTITVVGSQKILSPSVASEA